MTLSMFTAAPRFRSSRAMLLILTATAALGAGCGSSGSGGLFASSNEPPPALKGSEAIDRDAYGKLGYSLAWSSFAAFDTVNKGTLHRAEVLGDLLVISDDTTATCALNTSSGSIKWGLQIDDRADKFTGLFRLKRWVLATNETEMFAINAETGQLTDRQSPTRQQSTAPIVFGDLCVYGSGDRVVGYQLGVKGEAWGYRFPAIIRTMPVWTGGTTACFISDDGTVAILDCMVGSMVGSGRMFGDAGAPPAVGDGAVFVPSVDQSLWAFNLADGSRRWQVRTDVPLTATPAVYKGHVMVHVSSMGLVSVNSRTGAQEWVAKGVTGEVVAARKGRPIFWDKSTGIATMIDVSNGDIIEQVKLPNVAMIVNGVSVEDGDLYAISARGEVSKFVPR